MGPKCTFDPLGVHRDASARGGVCVVGHAHGEVGGRERGKEGRFDKGAVHGLLRAVRALAAQDERRRDEARVDLRKDNSS